MDRIPDVQLQDRLAAVRRVMAEERVDWLLAYGPPRRPAGGGTLHYLTGWSSPIFASAMIIGAEGRPLVLADGPHSLRIFRQRVEGWMDVRSFWGAAGLAKAIAEALTTGPAEGGRLGIVGEAAMPGALRDAVRAVAGTVAKLDMPIDAIRLVRTQEEVAMHRRAAEISDAMLAFAMDLARRPETTPADIMTGVEHEGRRRGADLSSLWLATGERPSTTYFEIFELNPVLGPNDRVQLGTTVTYEGHFAQGLRMGTRGKPSQALQDCARRLCDIQDEVLGMMRPGVLMSNIVDRLEALIDAACPYERAADPFRFQSCHALGIDYAEPACATALSPNRNRLRDAEGPVLHENMIFEIHPNFTLPELGHVCAGDMAIVTPAGARWMTTYPRGLVRLDN